MTGQQHIEGVACEPCCHPSVRPPLLLKTSYPAFLDVILSKKISSEELCA
jgi:hypothetical protein